MDRSRREFLKYFGALIIGGSVAYLGLDSYSEVTKTIYEGNKPTNATETVTITVTKPAINPQASQTYTTTTTQPPQNLEQILFGNSNMQFIPLEVTDVEIDNNTAYLTVVNYRTKTELQIELPIKYVSNGNINIKDLLSGVNNYNLNNGTNYRTYLVLGRANINQAVQQNGKWILPAPQIYYNILISDRGWKDIYKALPNLWNENAMVVMPTSQQGPYANSLWGWDNVNQDSIIILYQNGQQVNSVLNYINLADSILGTPNNSNPTKEGILHVDTIANTQGVGVYNNGNNQYPVYGVNNYYGTYIVLIQGQGNELFSNL
ncbi:MAG: hypothetical protein RXQ77_03170 [Candidatus Nanopusillus sp.]